ncbi:uncharacterized protein LOC144113661 [Amblyomma americanum]
MRSSSWTKATVEGALKLRLACGSRGYEYLRETGWPLPAERTLQSHIEDIKMALVATLQVEELYAAVLIDEILLTPGLDYDNSTRTVIASTFDASKLLELLFDVIRRSEQIGICVDCVTSDMGAGNQAVRLDYIKRLCETDEKHDLKLAPHLKPKYLSPNHYEKMNFVHQWFALMSSRTSKMALSDLCPEKGTEAVNFKSVIEVFTKLQIFDAGKSSSVWKPVQSGVIITTCTALRLRELMIKERGLKYLLLSRFVQDALENLFNTVRLKSPVPRARDFKYALRMIILAQFFQPSKKGSYQIDDGVQLAQFVSTKPNVLKPLEEEVEQNDVSLPAEEQECLHYLAGYITRKVIRKNKLCGVCSAALKGSSEDSGRLLKMKNYVEGKESLCIPSQPVTGLLQEAELYFRSNKKNITEVHLISLLSKLAEGEISNKQFPRTR